MFYRTDTMGHTRSDSPWVNENDPSQMYSACVQVLKVWNRQTHWEWYALSLRADDETEWDSVIRQLFVGLGEELPEYQDWPTVVAGVSLPFDMDSEEWRQDEPAPAGFVPPDARDVAEAVELDPGLEMDDSLTGRQVLLGRESTRPDDNWTWQVTSFRALPQLTGEPMLVTELTTVPCPTWTGHRCKMDPE